jgi:hypothetical protein
MGRLRKHLVLQVGICSVLLCVWSQKVPEIENCEEKHQDEESFHKQHISQGKERAKIQEESTIIYFTTSHIYQPSILSTLPLNTYLPTHHNARTKEKDRVSSIRIVKLAFS